MLKPIFAFLIALFITNTINAQLKSIANELTACNKYTENRTGTKINFPNSKNFLRLPNKWEGSFQGDNPRLIAQKTTDSISFFVKAYQVWDTFPKGELFEFLKEDNSAFYDFEYLNHHFLITKDLEGDICKIIWHVDESIEFKNRWMWTFEFKINSITNNSNILCDYHSIIIQIMKEHDSIKN